MVETARLVGAVVVSITIFLTVILNMEESILTRGPQMKKKSSTERSLDVPEITTDDIIYGTRSAFVIPEYKLIFFTFPKVACTEWKRMFMRINGNPNWCKTRNFKVHDPEQNLIKTLHDYEPEVATAMMTSPAWTRAAIFREPKERVLSAFLDKAINEKDYYVRHCCNFLPTADLKEQCADEEESFESFLYFVTEYPEECYDVHWEPQIAKMDSKWWDYIDVIGYQHNLLHDSKAILSQLTSARDESGQSAWERYGITGWGSSDSQCEKRPNSFLQENTSGHNLNAGSKMMKWYTAETEALVEEKWAIEWSQDKVKFPEVKLYKD